MLTGATEPAMPTEPEKPLIVISYAHADEPEHPAEGEVKWLSFVTGYLRPAIEHGAVELWIDRLMPGGADWEREIGEKLRACDIFILLVSPHSLSSDHVVDKEIAIIHERQAKGEDTHFYPLLLTPTPNIALDLVREKNLRPRGGSPFPTIRSTIAIGICRRRRTRLRKSRPRSWPANARHGDRRQRRRWRGCRLRRGLRGASGVTSAAGRSPKSTIRSRLRFGWRAKASKSRRLSQRGRRCAWRR